MDLEWATHPTVLLVNMLAAFRLTRIVVADAFPLGPIRLRFTNWANERWEPLQNYLRKDEAVRLEPDGVDTPRGVSPADVRKVKAYDFTAPLAYLATCYWCAGLYVSVVVALLASTGPWWTWAAVPLAVSATVGILANFSD